MTTRRRATQKTDIPVAAPYDDLQEAITGEQIDDEAAGLDDVEEDED